MDKTTTWLVRGAAGVVIAGSVFYVIKEIRIYLLARELIEHIYGGHLIFGIKILIATNIANLVQLYIACKRYTKISSRIVIKFFNSPDSFFSKGPQ